MNSTTLGKRYERLLFLSGILSIISIAVMLIASALTTQDEKSLAKCMNIASKIILNNEIELSKEWDKYQFEFKKNKYAYNSYDRKLFDLWLYPGIVSNCNDSMKIYFQKYAEFSPKSIVEKFDIEINNLNNIPIRFQGIELNSKAKINLMWNEISIPLDTFISIIQIALTPVLLLWLGSLYNTRYRETKLISRALDITNVYPHLINIYPVGNIYSLSLRKWSKFAYYIPPASFIQLLYGLARCFLVAIIVLPLVGSYLYSLYLIPINGNYFISYLMGAWIAITTIGVVFIELAHWHLSKIFTAQSNNF